MTIIKPSAYPNLFLTSNEKTIFSRGPLRLVFDGNNNLVYSYADETGSTSVSSNIGLTSGNWAHLAISADYGSSKLSLYLNGEKRDETEISTEAPLEISSSVPWQIGGTSIIWQDYFKGLVDDLRFYDTSLTSDEIQEIYNDDLSGVGLAGSKKQIVYDEGTDASGLTIAIDEDGYGVAKISEGGYTSTVFSEDPIRDGNWHHLVVTFGDLPNVFKMYVDDSLQGSPVFHDTSFVSLHLESPALGALNGSSLFPGYGSYRGHVDEFRIYDRGLSALEITEINEGDSINDGSLEFLAIKKADVFTMTATDILPTKATMRVNVESIGGEIEVLDKTLDLSFSTETFSTLQGWYSTHGMGSDYKHGEQVGVWSDLSGGERHFDNSSGDPRILHDGIKGRPVIAFDGNDLLWTSDNFDFLTESGYTLLTLARYSGSSNRRVISSRDRNFLFGFHDGRTSRWYAEGWISLAGSTDTDWHLHVGKIEAKGGDPAATFRKDGQVVTSGHRGSHNTAFGPGILQVGGYRTNSEMSACEVAEVMIYDRELNDMEILQLEGYVVHKWELSNELLSTSHPYFDSSPFGGSIEQKEKILIGGDRPVVKIFWGDEEIDSNSTEVDPGDDSKWDFVYEINSSNPVGIGTFRAEVDSLTQDTEYFYRAYAENLGGAQWAENTESFIAFDTTFTKHTMNGMVLWLDGQDIDGDGYFDNFPDEMPLPVWIDKSNSQKHAFQAVSQRVPKYMNDSFNGLPVIRFASGDAYNVGSLSLTYGGIHVFMVARGSGVGIGATNGTTGWSLDTKTGNAFGSFQSEGNTLQQIGLGFDPRTGYGMLVGDIAEIMVFDRVLPKAEKEMIEGYLAHKWGVVDDLAQSGFKITRGLRLYYPFNETDGSVVRDYSNELRHAEVIDAELNVLGKFGSGIEFESIDPYNARLDLLQNELDINSAEWTVSTWFETPITNDGVFDRHALFYGDPGYIYMLRDSMVPKSQKNRDL